MLCHLVAVSMDPHGSPIGLFTTNRWVTGESWFDAEDVIRLLDAFVIDHAFPSWPVNRWLSAMMVLFRPTIEALVLERDAVMRAWRARHTDRDAHEDRALEITSRAPIAIDARVEAVRRAAP